MVYLSITGSFVLRITGLLSFFLKLFFKNFLKIPSSFDRNLVKSVFVLNVFKLLIVVSDWFFRVFFIRFFVFLVRFFLLLNQLRSLIFINLSVVLHRLDRPIIFKIPPTLISIVVMLHSQGLILLEILIFIIVIDIRTLIMRRKWRSGT